MNPKTRNNFKIFFSISTLMALIGAFFKIMHWGYHEPILIICLFPTLAYVILGVVEVNNSTKIERSEKIMWTIGFIFFNFITALVYLFSGRKRIV